MVEPTLRKSPEQLTQLDRVDSTVPIFDELHGIQRDPFEHRSLIIGRQLTRDDMRGRANTDDRRVRDVHLITVGQVDLHPDNRGGRSPRGVTHTVIGSPVVRGNRFAISKRSSVSGSRPWSMAVYPPPILGIR